MKKETRTVVYDDELRLEAYHFKGTRHPFPNHFHEHYVVGFVEDGTRRLSCRNREYSIEKGCIVLFNPGDNYACVQSDDGTFDYRGFNIAKEVLLEDFMPVEILFFRFVMGFVLLFLACPHRLKTADHRQEITFVLAGLCGVCLYYLLENIALTYTMASNVGVIISVAPFFTAVLSHLFMKSEGKLRINFFIGFVVAMAGVSLISFNGRELALNPIGDILAVLFNLLYLGLGASALCFVTWNVAVKVLVQLRQAFIFI